MDEDKKRCSTILGSIRSLNSLMLVGGSEICGNTFGECSSNMIVDVIQHSYHCTVCRTFPYRFRVGPQIYNVQASIWATQPWVELGFSEIDLGFSILI